MKSSSRLWPLLAVVAVLAAGCGTGSEEASVDGESLSSVDRTERAPSADPALAGSALQAFGFDLLDAVTVDAGDTNVVISPTSVGVALAMLEPGTSGDAQRQLRDMLRIEDPDAFHASMNAFEQDVEARVAEAHNPEEDPGEVTVRIANAAYLQDGYPFRDDYLDRVGRHYGPTLHAVDFSRDPDAVAKEINRFVADATNDRIPHLVGDGVLRPETVLALVNALYLKASWLEVFDDAQTKDADFTRLDGSTVGVPLMHGRSGASAQGEGWVAATKSYVGGLEVQFVLPDEGRFEDIAGDLERVVAEFEDRRTSGAVLAVPRFETRFSTELRDTFERLGFTAAYQMGNLLGIADDPKLVLDVALHEAFLAMDEEGTEAAAATVLTAYPVSGPPSPPVPVVLDRPFLFRIYDQTTQATLFLGRILDPTA
jgi:serpin B